MDSSYKKSNLLQADLVNRAVLGTEAVRLDQLRDAISGVPQFGHLHTTGDISDFAQSLFYTDHTDSIVWQTVGLVVLPSVRVKPFGGILITSGVGLELDFGGGASQVAAGNHTHAQLHDALTLVSGVTLAWSLTGQKLGAEVRYGANKGLLSDSQGLALDFGTNAGQAAAGNHTHAQLHEALTTANSGTITLGLGGSGGQTLRADLNLSATAGGLVSGVDGLGVDFGSGHSQAARGDHTHPDADESTSGFLSVADKAKLDLFNSLLNADQCVAYYRGDACPRGEYVGGRRRFGQAMQVVEMHLTATPPMGVPCVLGLEVDGVVVEQIGIPAGTPPTEVQSQKTLTGIYVAASKYVRLLMVSGVGVIENEAGRIDCALSVRPAIATLSALKVNAGGGAATPFSADAYYGSGGSTQADSSTIDLGGVTSPAPQAVYQSARIKYSDPNPFSYLLTGLARGISYTVRLHFAELYWSAIGKQRMNIAVIGKTTATLSNYDTLSQTAGVKYKAVIEEFTVEPDNNGQMEVRLTPLASTDSTFNLSINGIELVPNS